MKIRGKLDLVIVKDKAVEASALEAKANPPAEKNLEVTVSKRVFEAAFASSRQPNPFALDVSMPDWMLDDLEGTFTALDRRASLHSSLREIDPKLADEVSEQQLAMMAEEMEKFRS